MEIDVDDDRTTTTSRWVHGAKRACNFAKCSPVFNRILPVSGSAAIIIIIIIIYYYTIKQHIRYKIAKR